MSDISGQAKTRLAGTYLTFLVGSEEYGVGILSVREIIGMLPITKVPGSHEVILGVVNLRGRVIQVMSMRARFSLPPSEPDPNQVIIIVEDAANEVIGLAVDAVREVMVATEADCAHMPDQHRVAADPGAVKGLSKNGGRVRILLDVPGLLAHIITAVTADATATATATAATADR